MGTYDNASGYPLDDSAILEAEADAAEQECKEHMAKFDFTGFDTDVDCEDMICYHTCPLSNHEDNGRNN